MKATALTGLRLAVVILGGNFVFSADAGHPSLRVRPIQTIACDSTPEGLAFEIKPMGYQPGFQVYYLVEGRDIAGFDSLVIETIKTPEGVDISKYANGTPAYTAGPFPRTSADGKYCVFSLDCHGNQYGKVDRLAIKGHVKVLVGTQRVEKKIEIKVNDKQARKLGPFSVQVTSVDEIAPVPAPATPTAAASNTGDKPKGGGNRAIPLPSSDPDTLSVEIKGPVNRLIAEKFTDGEDLSGNCCACEESHLYTVRKPRTGKFTVTICYWLDVKEVKLPIGQ